jgi:thiamine pyrophosphokinase
MNCVIFANGPLEMDRLDEQALGKFDLIIATDGGASHCRSYNLTPDVVIGDMDSIPDRLLEELQLLGVQIFTFPRHKDQTDLELAIDLAIERGATAIVILGALGERWDMSISSVMLLAAPRYAGIEMTVQTGTTRLFCLRGPIRKEFAGGPGDRLSILPLSKTVTGVTLQGLAYPLANREIPLGSTLGISNIVTAPEVSISLSEGILLCVIEKSGPDGIPKSGL